MKAIADRLDVSIGTVQRWRDRGHVLLYYRSGKGQNRRAWYTNDELITLSEIARCREDRLKVGLRRKKKESTTAAANSKQPKVEERSGDHTPQHVVSGDSEQEKD